MLVLVVVFVLAFAFGLGLGQRHVSIHHKGAPFYRLFWLSSSIGCLGCLFYGFDSRNLAAGRVRLSAVQTASGFRPG